MSLRIYFKTIANVFKKKEFNFKNIYIFKYLKEKESI